MGILDNVKGAIGQHIQNSTEALFPLGKIRRYQYNLIVLGEGKEFEGNKKALENKINHSRYILFNSRFAPGKLAKARGYTFDITFKWSDDGRVCHVDAISNAMIDIDEVIRVAHWGDTNKVRVEEVVEPKNVGNVVLTTEIVEKLQELGVKAEITGFTVPIIPPAEDVGINPVVLDAKCDCGSSLMVVTYDLMSDIVYCSGCGLSNGCVCKEGV